MIIAKDRKKYSDYEDFYDVFGRISEVWVEYISRYVKRTSEIFTEGGAEFPWLINERAIVSTLIAAISKNYDAVILEELPVIKPSDVDKATNDGRADLWCSLNINKNSIYSFYLEAKYNNNRMIKFNTERVLEDTDKGLIAMAFRDFLKSHGLKNKNIDEIPKISPYANEPNRKHSHHYIALIISPIRENNESGVPFNISNIDNMFKSKINISLTSSKLPNKIRREVDLNLYPSLGFIYDNGCGHGFVASFLLLGESQ